MKNIIDNTVEFVKQKLEGAEAGHDWFHIERVWKLSKKIAEDEECNHDVVELSDCTNSINTVCILNDFKLNRKVLRNFTSIFKWDIFDNK